MAEGEKYKAWLRQGNPLLIVTAALLAALGDAEAFPQDRTGIEALIAAVPKGPEGEEVKATYEDPNGPLTYLGSHGKWVAPAGGGRLRIRMRALGGDELASRVWTLGPDGSLSNPERITADESSKPRSPRWNVEPRNTRTATGSNTCSGSSPVRPVRTRAGRW